MKTKNILLLCAMSLIIILPACQKNDAWNDFYHKNEAGITDSGLLVEELGKIPGISKFVNAVKETGVDTIINKNQLFTIFAFKDEAFDSMPDEVKNNPENLREAISFHVYYNKMSSLTIQEGLYKTLSGKYSLLEVSDDNTITINGNSNVIESDYVAKNGIVHILDVPSVPNPNLYQLLSQNQQLKKYMNYINDQKLVYFDRDHSEITGFNDEGGPIYDSVFVSMNLFMKNYPINSEDDQFTMLIPLNITDAIEVAKAPLRGEVPDNYFIAPVMKSGLLRGVYKREELNPDLLTVEGSPISPELLNLISADNEGTPLSNGRAFMVDGYQIDKALVYTPVSVDKFEMFNNATMSNPVITTETNDNTFKAYWIPTDKSVQPEAMYGEYIDFVINKDFFPLDYKMILNLRPYASGLHKVEVNGVEVENSPMWIEDLAEDVFQDVEMGTVSFDKMTNPVTVRITFLEQHKRTDVSWTAWKKQYLLCNGIRFEPILN